MRVLEVGTLKPLVLHIVQPANELSESALSIYILFFGEIYN